MKKISWGVISTANIGMAKVIPAMQKGTYCQVNAIASRSLETAQKAAEKLSIDKAYGSYKDLLADGEIQAVYIPLPNHLHVPWIIECLKAGKHVLCEKPLTMNYADALFLQNEIKKYPGLKVMEAFMYRHHPQIIHTKKMITEGKIGPVRNMHAVFNYFNVNPDNIRNKADIGGGGLLDIGCYCISITRFFFGSEPLRVSGFVEYDPVMKIDRLASGLLEFDNGSATFSCSTQMADHQYAVVFGPKGKIELTNPFTPQANEKTSVTCTMDSDNIEKIEFEAVDQYTLQGDLFSKALLEENDIPTPLEDALANMKVIDAVFESAQKRAFVSLM